MKSVLIPTFPDLDLDPVFDLAVRIARDRGSHLTGIAVDSPFAVGMSAGFMGEADLLYAEQRAGELEKAGESVFRAAMAKRDVPATDRSATGLGHTWLDRGHAPRLSVPEMARVFDLTVLPLPGKGAAVGSQTILESCLFDGGHAMLVAPPVALPSFGTHVVIAWNNSSETARTISLGMGFLRAATKVTVLGVEGIGVTGPDVEAVALQLVRHGIAVATHVAPLKNRNGGQAFLEEAHALGGDLMFKGAYTQSRIRQMIFGGATAHLLANSTMPMIMAH